MTQTVYITQYNSLSQLPISSRLLNLTAWHTHGTWAGSPGEDSSGLPSESKIQQVADKIMEDPMPIAIDLETSDWSWDTQEKRDKCIELIEAYRTATGGEIEIGWYQQPTRYFGTPYPWFPDGMTHEETKDYVETVDAERCPEVFAHVDLLFPSCYISRYVEPSIWEEMWVDCFRWTMERCRSYNKPTHPYTMPHYGDQKIVDFDLWEVQVQETKDYSDGLVIFDAPSYINGEIGPIPEEYWNVVTEIYTAEEPQEITAMSKPYITQSSLKTCCLGQSSCWNIGMSVVKGAYICSFTNCQLWNLNCKTY